MLVTVGFSIASDYVQEEAYYIIPICILPCAVFGVWYAYSVITDRLPELVGLFNSFGGLAAALEGIAVYTDRTAVMSMYTGEPLNATEQKIQLVVLYLSIMVGMMTFTGSVVAVLKLTGGWIKHEHKIDNVTLTAEGVATFPKDHKLRGGHVDEKSGRCVDSDILGLTDKKGRNNRYALDLTFTNGDEAITLTAFSITNPKTLQMTADKKKAEADMAKATKPSKGSYTCTWTHETENFWHINAKPRALCGGKIPQIILLAGCLMCCAITYAMDETTCTKDGCLPGQSGTPLYLTDDELLGTILIVVLAVLSGLIGILQAMAVSGADMAVVICVLNSGSGWSGVAAGFMISNELLLVTGAFVGASGAILSYLMCEAMNVPILRVLGMMAPPKEEVKTGNEVELPEPQKEDATQIADRLREAKTVIIAPGYGMAAGKAQGVVGKLAETLRDQGKEVRFCIHPVAGRLPGHMNILLAEAQVPYDWVCAMDEINPDFKNTDIALCIGAWDTVNPAASEDPDCPVYGMPMCRVWDAKICVVNKRSLGSASGFSGAQNILPHKENTRMLLGSAADKVQELLDIIGKDAKVDGQAEEGIAEGVAGPTGPTKRELAAMPTYGKTICVPKETSDPSGGILGDPDAELRCAMSPKAALHLRQKLGFEVIVEAGCGARSLITDEMYEAVGVKILPAGTELYESADIMLKVNPPVCRSDIDGKHELDMLKENATYIGFLPIMNPHDTPEKCGDDFKDIVLRAVDKKINLLSMGHLPRISRAQKSDALSTFGKLAGHRACIEAASAYGRIMPGEITSAGKNPQAKAWVGGCGVAGLEAVAILKKMGCEVYATDVRDIEDQIISVGGKFVHYDPEGLKKAKDSGGYAPSFGPEVQVMQDKMYAEWSAKMDVMVLTAAIPGRPPPQLVSKTMVSNMKPGSVIVDIAASAKWAALYKESDPKSPWPGNCEFTVPGKVVKTSNGVTIIGYTDMPSRFGNQATDFYSNNLVNLLEDMCAQGTIAERGLKEPELGTAEDFKIDMHVVRSQTNTHASYSQGEFAEGDDVMTGMCLVKVEDGVAMLDCPKKRKPMETAQAIFEKKIKGEGLSIEQMEQKLTELESQKTTSSRNLMAKFETEDVGHAFKVVSSQSDPTEKVEASLIFAETKAHADMVKWMSGMIKKEKQEATKRDKEERLKALQAAKSESGPCATIILSLLGLGACGVMGFYPFPQYFIGNMMIFVLASVLGYCLVASVKPSLHTPLMSMSNAISGIVIIGGMYQIQGKWLWGGEGWQTGVGLETPIGVGGVTLTQVLGAVAVAISAINIAGGFAVTFRMLAMFQSSDTAKP